MDLYEVRVQVWRVRGEGVIGVGGGEEWKEEGREGRKGGRMEDRGARQERQ